MPKKLYVVTVETEFVFASESDNPFDVEQEFQRALENNYTMRDELDTDPEVRANHMTYLPGPYNLTDLPWGDNEDDKTIQDFIDEGGAPKYIDAHNNFVNFAPKLEDAALEDDTKLPPTEP